MLIGAVLILMTVGVVMMFSASFLEGKEVTSFLNKQLIWLVISGFAAFFCARIDLGFLRKMALPAAAVCIFLLLFVLTEDAVKGSRRWINVFGMTLQPSEFSKIGIILASAWWICCRRRYMHTFNRGLLVPILGLGVFAGLLIVEPDFGTTLLVSMVVFTLLYIGGARPSWLMGFVFSGAGLFALMLACNPNRKGRILAFLNPEIHAQDGAWQLVNAKCAFAAGGQWGTGLGNSIQKLSYLPEAHTDFIFPIIGEELGIIATTSILLLFVVIFICGLRIADRAHDDFGRFTALGITLMITFQAMINIAVVTGSVPTKGIALPFISYGGSSLLVCSAMIGLLVNVGHTARSPKSKKKTALFKDKRRKA